MESLNHAHHSHFDHNRLEENVTNTVLQGKHINNFRLAVSATIHCLIECGIGELIGMILSFISGLDTVSSTVLSVLLGFVAGLTLGIRPLIKAKFSISNAIKTIFVAEGISIIVMEGFEVLTMIMIPGVMEASIFDLMYWMGMVGGLAVGFIMALPINYMMIKRGIRHKH